MGGPGTFGASTGRHGPGAVMSVGVVLSARRGVADSRLLTVLVIAAVACVVLFVAGGLIFGY